MQWYSGQEFGGTGAWRLMRTEPPETARVLGPGDGLGAAPYVALTACACLVCIGISVLSVVNDDPGGAMGWLLVALACIPFGIATAKALRVSRMDASGVWKAHWYGWRFYPVDEIESVEWYVDKAEGGGLESHVLLRLHGTFHSPEVYRGTGIDPAEAVATEVGDLLVRPVRRDSSMDRSERFRDWPTRRPKRTRRKVGGDTTTPD